MGGQGRAAARERRGRCRRPARGGQASLLRLPPERRMAAGAEAEGDVAPPHRGGCDAFDAGLPAECRDRLGVIHVNERIDGSYRAGPGSRFRERRGRKRTTGCRGRPGAGPSTAGCERASTGDRGRPGQAGTARCRSGLLSAGCRSGLARSSSGPPGENVPGRTTPKRSRQAAKRTRKSTLTVFALSGRTLRITGGKSNNSSFEIRPPGEDEVAGGDLDAVAPARLGTDVVGEGEGFFVCVTRETRFGR